MNKLFKKVLGIALLLIASASLIHIFTVMGSLATVSIQPYITKVWGTDEVFTVNITVTDVTNLYGWEIKLYYDSSILNGTSVSEGSFLKGTGETFFNYTIDDNYDATHGRIKVFNTLLGEIPGASGTGVLCIVTFETRDLGISALDLEDTLLADLNSNLMPHTTAGGAVQVVRAVHDVAIRNVSASLNVAVNGQIVEIYVTATNLGNKTETFQVTTYFNETAISEQTVDGLSPQVDIALTFLWNTAPITPNATCIIKAEASQVQEETNLENNVFVYGAVTIVQGKHDVAVIDVRPSSDKVYEGEVLNIYVTVANKGNYTETFNVTVYRDDIPVGVQTVENLTYGRVSELIFPWDTEGVGSNKTYGIKAVASTVEGETSFEDNILTDGNVTVYPYGSLSIDIVEVIPSDQLGQPVTGFLAGTVANFKLTLDCTLFGAKSVLLTINLYDAGGNTIGVVSFQGPIASGKTTFVLGMPIPSTAGIGEATVYANVLSDWPHLGGIPHSPEESATFEIRGS